VCTPAWIRRVDLSCFAALVDVGNHVVNRTAIAWLNIDGLDELMAF